MNTCDIVLAIDHPGHVVAETVAAKKLTLESFTLTVSLAVPGMITMIVRGIVEKRMRKSGPRIISHYVFPIFWNSSEFSDKQLPLSFSLMERPAASSPTHLLTLIIVIIVISIIIIIIIIFHFLKILYAGRLPCDAFDIGH